MSYYFENAAHYPLEISVSISNTLRNIWTSLYLSIVRFRAHVSSMLAEGPTMFEIYLPHFVKWRTYCKCVLKFSSEKLVSIVFKILSIWSTLSSCMCTEHLPMYKSLIMSLLSVAVVELLFWFLISLQILYLHEIEHA